MVAPTRFHRPVSPTERLYLSTREVAPPFAIQLVVEGDGEIDTDDVRAAVAIASHACPGARLVLEDDRWVDSGTPPRVEQLTGRVDWDALDTDPVLHRPIGPGPEATTEVVVLRAAGNKGTTVIFRAFHGVMDAGGMSIWVGDVFRILRGEEPLGAPDVDADSDLVARLGASGAPTRLVPTRPSPFGRAAPGGGPVFLLRHRSVAARVPAVVAKVAAVIAEHCADTARIMVPVDLRRHDPGIRSTANLALPLFLDVAPGQGWDEVNAQLLAGMVERRELNEMEGGGLSAIPQPVTRGILRAAHAIGARTGRNVVSGIVSHAGQVDLEQFSLPGFEPVSVRAVPSPTGLVPVSVALVEHRGSTEITVSARGGRGVAEQLDELLDEMVDAVSRGAGDRPVAAARPVVPALPLRAGAVTTPGGATAVEMFRRHARVTPDAVAVTAPGGPVTYGELDLSSDTVAAELIRRGIGRGDVVAVLADRTVAGAAAQLGVMKAGAAFLPLDRRHPAARIRATIDDSGAALILVERDHLELAGPGVTVVLEEVLADPGEAAVAPPDLPDVEPQDIAYVTYTSGSTGRPKGVLVPHAGVVNFVRSATDWYRLGPETRFAHYHTPAADMACAAFFCALLTGGAVTLLPDDVSPVSLRHMFVDSGANTFLLTPSLMSTIVRLDIEAPPVRTVIIGGEKLYPSLAEQAREFFGAGPKIVNSYGPTELSIVCTTYDLDDARTPDAPAAESVPIGHASSDTPVFLLDESGRSVPVGEVGELYFGGPQVAAGYLGRPELTAERFVSVAGERTYRTGDLARVLEGGLLEFVGRADDQVKIRGNRIEPGEVQAVLETYPDVAACAVVPRKRAGGAEPMLVAYVVPKTVVSPSGGVPEFAVVDARDFLSGRLPSFMIPAAIVAVPALPVTLNGKLDLAALPLPVAAEGHTSTGGGDELPAEEWAATARIWADVLRVDVRVLTEDSDFFVLGGDSLAAVEMLARVSRTTVGAEREARFVAGLEGFAHRLTLGRVHAAALAARGEC
ncbi:non-ribosomal peptide synthetase [Rhodococcus triatomae]|uniref:Amino acid adenylation domain-containing protein n=1 Tax=Rhodococcus triatomae TaxID=300028 RepID=A0A1G8L6E0_9NOCA|nr:non-ribosomal peptide synthetase [Rhodococcus triatomae]QNG20516.1 non-ribosomal peptide synthetase [Rhodococcus triatomae]QNG23566.1 non-ribosomal peptide synthetase [Rhodococcus triatomae]SDI51222.1 amino acid adenylation domain-containing protein [Rhodococcus triatomae]